MTAMSTTTLVEKEVDAPPIDISALSEKEKEELIEADSKSIASSLTRTGSYLSFHTAKRLHVHTKGMSASRPITSPRDLEIPIYNTDGSLAYQSTRQRRTSGNCVLNDAAGTRLLATEYFFGPGRDPVMHLLNGGNDADAAIKTTSRWTSRTQTFMLSDGSAFTWSYKKELGFGAEGKKGVALVLEMNGKRIAALIRNKETRTSGSKSCSAGNGGELVIGEDVGGKGYINEAVVVASCILMLKKEVDRRRMTQIMVIGAVVS